MNPFSVLGLKEDATIEEVERAYQQLKNKYRQDRYEVGERGEEAAENLDKLEVAYNNIKDIFEREEIKKNFGTDFGVIEYHIKNNELTAAQEKLDAISERSGEWHYLQSIICYKRNWFLESKKQLEFAISMDPTNTKYTESYEKLTKITASRQVRPEDLRSKENAGERSARNGSAPNNCASNCCCGLCATDICCECLGGDCIPCC